MNRRWFAEEKRFCLWMTNLPRAAWSAEQMMSLYRSHWQVELLFKEWKSHNLLKGFVAGEKAIAEGLEWNEPAVAGDEKTGRAECDDKEAIYVEEQYDMVVASIGSR